MQKAIDRLQTAGISRDRIDVSGNQQGISASSSTGGSASVNPVSGSPKDENSVSRTSDDRTVDREGRNTNIFTDFFNNLFGGKDDDDSNRFSHVASRSRAVLTVHANSSEEAETAADILDDCGAANVEEKAAQYGYTSSQSTTGSSDRTSLSGDASQRMGGSMNRMRSRIFDQRIDEPNRLRGLDHQSGFGTTGSGNAM